ncbi:hypothetical protein ABZU78_25715 [Rhodococcus erythropolis]|uniref:hypothetical protein n=1 Tax=Rhodococcus erythropolis TaxID=1833 RepID=UPI0033A143CB
MAEIDDAATHLERYAAAPFEDFADWRAPTVKGVNSDSQLVADQAVYQAMANVAAAAGIPMFGEEDEYRALANGHERDAARLRSGPFRDALLRGDPAGFSDPIDGTNQAEAMSIRSAFGHAVALKYYGEGLVMAVVLGCGKLFTTDGRDVYLGEALEAVAGIRLDPIRVTQNVLLDRVHAVVPASKAATLGRAYAMSVDPDGFQYIAPLAGIPGILNGLIDGGCVAAVQAESYAWDQMAAYFCAVLGMPVLTEHSDDILGAYQVQNLLLRSMTSGYPVPTLFMGKNLSYAEKLRSSFRQVSDPR